MASQADEAVSVVSAHVAARTRRLVELAATERGVTKSRWAAEALHREAIRQLQQPNGSRNHAEMSTA